MSLKTEADKMAIRRHSMEEQLMIVKEAEETGNLSETARKYKIARTQIEAWRRKYNKGVTVRVTTEDKVYSGQVRELQRENYLLKQLLAEKELELSVKSSLLKKTLLLTEQK